MNLFCALFGHSPALGYGNVEGQGYFRVGTPFSDGINRHHARLHCDCARCGERYQVGMIHIPCEYVDAQVELFELKEKIKNNHLTYEI